MSSDFAWYDMPFTVTLSTDTLPDAIHFSAVRLEQTPVSAMSLLSLTREGPPAFAAATMTVPRVIQEQLYCPRVYSVYLLVDNLEIVAPLYHSTVLNFILFKTGELASVVHLSESRHKQLAMQVSVYRTLTMKKFEQH